MKFVPWRSTVKRTLPSEEPDGGKTLISSGALSPVVDPPRADFVAEPRLDPNTVPAAKTRTIATTRRIKHLLRGKNVTTRGEMLSLAKAKSVEEVQRVQPASPTRCKFLGDHTGSVKCPSCKGHVEVKTFACSKFGTCTLGKRTLGLASCSGCKEYRSASSTPITKRNLLYYIYPVSDNGVWQKCVDELLPHLGLFNGKIVVFVAQDPEDGRRPYGPVDGPRTGSRTDSLSHVVTRFGPKALRVEFLTGFNSADLWESAHHNRLFSRVHSLDPSEATLYAHAKGVTRPNLHPAHRWRQVALETLANWPTVERSLDQYPVTGSFKKIGRGWAKKESSSQWHYSGSFWWFRNQALFSRKWQKIDKFWAAIESYPSLHFTSAEAGCVFHEARVANMNLYNLAYWDSVVEPELLRWREQNPNSATVAE